MKLIQINNLMINFDLVTVIERKDSGHVWLYFGSGPKGTPDVPLNPEESTKLWDYLRNQSQDMME